MEQVALKETEFKIPNFASGAEILSGLKQMIDDEENAAFLCAAIRSENPNYLAIMYANRPFERAFDNNLEELLGKSYDFLFEDIDVNYSSDDQLEYIRLVKSVKARQECSIIMKLNNRHEGELQIAKFKIIFKPFFDEKSEKFYAIFGFEKISEEIFATDKERPQNQLLIKNLERALNNEKLLRQISYLIISDKPVKEIAQNIAESLCKNLKLDRCIINDRKDEKSSFIIEYCNEKIKPMLDKANKEKGLDEVNNYINFQNNFFEKIKINAKNSALFVVNDVKSDQAFASLKGFYDKFSVTSQIVAITSFDNEINGGIYIHLTNQRTLTVDEIELIETIADQLAIAIDRSYSIEKVMIANHNLLTKTLELKEVVKKEKEMRKMQTEFVALVSHEFKTPLQIIDSTRELMARKLKSFEIKDESLDKYLDRIKSGIQRMTGLINSTLDLAKLDTDSSEIKVEKQIFSLNDLIEDVIDKTSNLAVGKNIKIITKLCEENSEINADQKLLDHCFANVISNAIKYSKNDAEVNVIMKCNAGKVAVRIIDHGMGIPKEDIENIGKKFFRAKNTLSVSGTGIGIYLTKYFVELHNGSVLIESELNVGTTVTIILPR